MSLNNTWVEVSESALLNNLSGLKRLLVSGTSLMFVVKANGYGHGLTQVADIAEQPGSPVDSYGVHLPEDGVSLRTRGITKDIYILGYANESQLGDLVFHDLSPVVTNSALIPILEKEASRQKKKIRITLKCETGTHRQGLLPEEIPEYASLLRRSPSVILEGLSTHFANIEDTSDHSYAKKQMSIFKDFIHGFQKAGFSLKINHIACSAATVLFPETHYQMVRTGISSYGYWSSRETALSFRSSSSDELILKPALTWKTRIGQIKDVEADAYIGYGCTYKTDHPTRLAILPVGYYDGYDRRLSNSGYVLIRGKRAPVRGRVCMNMIIVDITHIPGCRLDDEAILLGSSGEERITADDLAALSGTINYEILSRINPLIPRRIVS